jgi:hypothetical protein
MNGMMTCLLDRLSILKEDTSYFLLKAWNKITVLYRREKFQFLIIKIKCMKELGGRSSALFDWMMFG